MVIDTIETDEGGQEIFRQPQNLAVKIRRAWTLDVEGRAGGAGPAPPGSMLEGAPTNGTTDAPNWSDRRWGQQVHDYYGARALIGRRRRITRVAGCGVRATFSLPGSLDFALPRSVQWRLGGARALSPATSRGPFLRGVLVAGR